MLRLAGSLVFLAATAFASTPNMEAFIDQCPASDPAAPAIFQNFHILRNGTPVTFVNCTEPVTAMLASADLDVIRIQQTLRLIYYMDLDTPVQLPWTSLRMYDWIKSKIAGVDIDTTSSNSYCCSALAGGTYVAYGVLGATGTSRLGGLQIDGLISMLGILGHETRHVDGYGHLSCCGVTNGCDPTYDEANLSAYGIQYYLYRLFLNGSIQLNIQCLDPPRASQIVGSLLTTENLYPARFCDAKPSPIPLPAMPGGACAPGNIPHLVPGGVVNAASYQSTGNLPGGVVSLFGTALAGDTASAQASPLPRTLNGVSVEIAGIAAPLFLVSPTQINAQIPYEIAPAPSVPVRVKTAAVTGFTYSVPVNVAGPGIFTTGLDQAVIQNSDNSANSAGRPALAGSVIVVYFTGLGKLDHPVPTGALAPITPLSQTLSATKATIGNLSADVLFVGLTPGAIGLAQANVRVPTLPPGNYPIVLVVDGVASNPAVLSVN